MMDWLLEDEDCGTEYELDCECGNDCDMDFADEPYFPTPSARPAAIDQAPKAAAQPKQPAAPERRKKSVRKSPLTKKEKRKELFQVAIGSLVVTAIFLFFFVIRFFVV